MFAASFITSLMKAGTGAIFCVARLTTTIVIVELRTPVNIGANCVVSTRLKYSQKKATEDPTIIDASAPGVFAFLHQTAQK